MKRPVWVLVNVLLATLLGIAMWRYTHPTYPNAVYYQRVVLSFTGQGGSTPPYADTWIDPQRGFLKMEGPNKTGLLRRDGRDYTLPIVLAATGQPSPPEALRTLSETCAELRQHGFSGEGKALLAHAVGGLTHLQFEGHQAIRFDTVQHDPHAIRVIVWVDARTLLPLQYQTVYPNGLLTQRFVHSARLTPGALPSDFFDVPRTNRSLWDRFGTWVDSHFGGHFGQPAEPRSDKAKPTALK